MGEWILIWTLVCKQDFHPDCKYYHKSYLTLGECAEMLAEKDHKLSYSYERYIPHVIYCTKDIELREKVREHNRTYHSR